MAKGPNRYRLNNLGGGINSMSEDGTLISVVPNGTNVLGQITVRSECKDMENFNMLNRGGLRKTYGYGLHKNTGVSSPITGLYEFIQRGTSPVFMYSQADKVYTLISGTATDTGATITSGAYVDFCTANNSLVICDGYSAAPQIWNGTSISAMAGSPPSAAKQSVFIQDRLWIFAENSSTLYYSTADNINSGYSTQYVNCNSDDGQKITAIAPFYIPGSGKATVMVAKERSVGLIDGAGTVDDPFTFKKIKFDGGVPGFRQFAQFGQDIAFLTQLGVTSYDTAIQFVNLKEQYLSYKVQDKFTALSSAYLLNAIAFMDVLNQRIGFAVTESGYTYNNVLWYYDLVQGGWYKTRPTDDITAAFVDHSGVLYTANSTGKIFVWGTSYTDFNGSAISAYYTTPHLDFFEPYLEKRITKAQLSIRGNGSYNLGIGTTVNYSRTGKSHTITLNNANYTWNGGTWTSDSGVYQWGASNVQIRSFIPSGWFQAMQLNLTQSGANEPIDIYNLEFDVDFGEMR